MTVPDQKPGLGVEPNWAVLGVPVFCIAWSIKAPFFHRGQFGIVNKLVRFVNKLMRFVNKLVRLKKDAWQEIHNFLSKTS